MKGGLPDNKFNFCAALFRELWLAYHLMYIEFLIICVVNLAVNVAINLWIAWNIGRITKYVPFLLILMVYVVEFMLFGRFGNQILNENAKTEMQKQNKTGTYSYCIHLMRANEKNIVFRGASVVVCAVIIIFIDVLCLPGLVGYFLY